MPNVNFVKVLMQQVNEILYVLQQGEFETSEYKRELSAAQQLQKKETITLWYCGKVKK